MEISLERLNMEYVAWSLSFGDGRDDKDIRFGQHITNNYDVTKYTDVFHAESAEGAFISLLEEIYKSQPEEKEETDEQTTK